MKHALPTLLLLSCLVTPAFAQAPSEKGGGRATPVVVAAAKKKSFFDTVEALGTLRANETVTLTATVTETVTSVNFTDGQRVEAGDVLLEMTSGQEKAQLDQASAEEDEAKQQLNRVAPLVKQGAASASLLDQRRREYETAKGRLAEVKSRMEDYLITAPFSGVLGLRNISIGALVRPGDPITTLDDDSVMKLDFSVPSVFLTSLKVGLPIVATAREFNDQKFKGEIASIDSQIDPITRAIMVRALIPNEDHILRPGLLMSVDLQSNQRMSIVLPEESLIPEGYNNYVLMLDKSQNPPVVRKTKITVGARRPGEIEVLDGLKEGALVVTHGTMNARDGQPVSVTAQEEGNETLPEILKKSNTGGKQERK